MTNTESKPVEWWLDHDCYYSAAEIKLANESEYPISKENLIHVISKDYHDVQIKRLEAEKHQLYESRKEIMRNMDRISKSYNFDQQNIKDLTADRDKWKKCAEEMAWTLGRVQRHGLHHYEDCKNIEYGDQNCTCGMERTEIHILNYLTKFRAINEPKGE